MLPMSSADFWMHLKFPLNSFCIPNLSTTLLCTYDNESICIEQSYLLTIYFSVSAEDINSQLHRLSAKNTRMRFKKCRHETESDDAPYESDSQSQQIAIKVCKFLRCHPLLLLLTIFLSYFLN